MINVTDQEMNSMKKKHISLSITILITLFIFTMSVIPGSDSSDISSGISLTMKNLWDQIFINHPIALDTMHAIIRKGAHVFEYFILAISYFITAKYYKLSILKIGFYGLLTASVDEIIQSFVPDRAGRLVDVLVFDFGGFMLGLGIMLLLFNRQKYKNDQEILQALQDNEISTQKAYKYIYNHEPMMVTNHAHFVKLNIIVPDEEGATKFLKVLFFFPIPLGLVKFGLMFVKNEYLPDEFSKEDILDIITQKGIKVDVKAKDGVIVNIKTI